MPEWLEAARDRIAAASGVDAAELALTDGNIANLLDLARIAAHESGDRTNAPLACYLVGLALGRNPDLVLAELANTAASPGIESE